MLCQRVGVACMDITFFYSSLRDSPAAFRRMLQGMPSNVKGFRIVSTLEQIVFSTEKNAELRRRVTISSCNVLVRKCTNVVKNARRSIGRNIRNIVLCSIRKRRRKRKRRIRGARSKRGIMFKKESTSYERQE